MPNAHIRPGIGRALIRTLPPPDQSAGGIFLPGKDPMESVDEGVVIAVGPGRFSEKTGKTEIPPVRSGMRVLYQHAMPLDAVGEKEKFGEDLVLVFFDGILGVVGDEETMPFAFVDEHVIHSALGVLMEGTSWTTDELARAVVTQICGEVPAGVSTD